MTRFLFFLFCMALFGMAKGQRNYAEAMHQGDVEYDSSHYKTAINKYFAAEAFEPIKKDSVKAKVNRTFDKIEALRIEATNLKEEADKQKARAEAALKDAKKQTTIAQANSLISEAKSAVIYDPTLALRLAEQAIKMVNSPKNLNAASNIYANNSFYKIVGRHNVAVSSVAFSPPMGKPYLPALLIILHVCGDWMEI